MLNGTVRYIFWGESPLKQKLLKILFISVLGTLLFWGAALLPFTTMSATQGQISILPECRTDPTNFTCHSKFKHAVSGGDPGAALWVTMSLSYFRNHHRQEASPKWSPYIGTGYPLFLDGHHRIESPIELFTSYFPQDQGRDFVTVFRIFFFTLTVLLIIGLFTESYFYLILGGVLANTSHYVAGMVDVTYLDLDMIAPWFLYLLLKISLFQKTSRLDYMSSTVLAVYIGLQGFVQAFVSYLAMLILVTVVLFYFCKSKKHFVYQVLILLFVPLIFQFNYLLNYAKYISEFLSSRNSFACIAHDSAGFLNTLRVSLKWTQDPTSYYLINLVAWPFVFFNFKNISAKRLFILFLFTASIQIFGMPALICKLPFVSGVRFWRHFMPYNNLLSIVLITIGCYYFIEYIGQYNFFKRHRKKWYALVVFFVVVPSSHDNYFNYKFLIGRAGAELPAFAATAPVSSPIFQVQKLSQAEDRRHFSPQAILFPNWSQVLDILDMRLLYALYLNGYHQLNGSLSGHWQADSGHLIKPDRFTGFDSDEEMLNPNVTKMLALNRVSLLSFKNGHIVWPNEGPYAKENCQLLAADAIIESYLCNQIGGISFFPVSIATLNSESEILQSIKSGNIEASLNTAFVTAPELNKVGQGQILKFTRNTDSLIYDLKVERAGLFVITDSYFPAWHAYLDEVETPIYRVNVNFKGILLPEGKHKLALRLQP
jgi:hypothetical protein